MTEAITILPNDTGSPTKVAPSAADASVLPPPAVKHIVRYFEIRADKSSTDVIFMYICLLALQIVLNLAFAYFVTKGLQ